MSVDGRSDFDDVENPPIIEASLIKDTLLATAKTTLRTLTILAFHEPYDSIGSLRDFEVLTELHTNWSLLVRRASILQTVLPASLRHLKLEDEMDDGSDDYRDFVQDALSANRSGTLHLETITLTTLGWKKLDKLYCHLHQVCREQGLTLNFVKG